MKKNNRSSKRSINQLITLVVFAIFAAVTWWNNEKKDQATAVKKAEKTTATAQSVKGSTAPPPSQLGRYDTVMANDNLGQNKTAPVDYYMLALSWSPSFCDIQRQKNDGNIPSHLQYQCQQNLGWVIHGLWPQSLQARSPNEHPRFCQGDLPALPESTIRPYLAESPGATLLQGQWEKHGACAFEYADHYFAKQKSLFQALQLPSQELSRKALFKWMREHNPHLNNAYLRASKNELYICYDKNWQVMDCPQ